MRIEAGRVAVVTGGASGIGYALAAAAADRVPEVEQRFAAIVAGGRPRE
jgi:NAD(P)-dependent dehydrogenase (short-subunit alcohol dehydrogenase family)